MTTQETAAKAAADLIKSAADIIQTALGIMEQHDLNLENYPEYWHDFSEHPSELRNMFVTDFKDIQIQVGE